LVAAAAAFTLWWRWNNKNEDMWTARSLRASGIAVALVYGGLWWQSDISNAQIRDPDIGIAMRQFQNLCSSTTPMVVNHPFRSECLPKKMGDGTVVFPPVSLRHYEKFCAVMPADVYCQYSEIDLMKAEPIK
jgi:hypothetical protein